MADGAKTKLLCFLLATCVYAMNQIETHATRTTRLAQYSNGASVTAGKSVQDEGPVVDEKERRDMRRTYVNRLRQPAPRRQRPTSPPRRAPSTNVGAGAGVGTPPPPEELQSDAAEVDFIGYTMWEMQPAADTPEEVEKKIKEGRDIFYGERNGRKVTFNPVRTGGEGELYEGRFYRFSVTTTRAGFLYLISREEYADGGTGEPKLLFPIKRAGGEDNGVQPGRVVEIPHLLDDPGYFAVRRTRRDHIGEILIIIVSETPLDLPSGLGAEPLKLSARQVAEWEARWGVKGRWVDEPSAAGSGYTAAEEKAGADAKQLLTEKDPLPQRLYSVPSRQGVPLLVKLRLRYARL